MSLAAPSAKDPWQPALDRLRERLGPKGYLDRAAEADPLPFTREMRGRFTSQPLAVMRPADTAEVAAAVAICAEAGLAIVPQGGNTGLVGGTVIGADRPAVILSTGRLDRVRAIDPVDQSMIVEAGCILENLQKLADAHGCHFPLALGAQGSCQIGGNLATNAGGILTIGHGNARDLVLGLEVVLADGRLWNGLSTLRKDNTGYDLKQLFLGSEGTLGIITAAALKIFPKPALRETAFLALSDPEAALDLLGRLQRATGGGLTAYEILPRAMLELALEHVPGTLDPLDSPARWYVIVEATAGTAQVPLRAIIEASLAEAMEQDQLSDGTFAESEQQRCQLWFIREAIVEAVRASGLGSVHHDVSVPVSRSAMSAMATSM